MSIEKTYQDEKEDASQIDFFRFGCRMLMFPRPEPRLRKTPSFCRRQHHCHQGVVAEKRCHVAVASLSLAFDARGFLLFASSSVSLITGIMSPWFFLLGS
ncbi:unnamed protein product [Ectocarpus sp. 4 AP-2014]